MAVTYSVQATVFRSTNFDRETFRKLGLTSERAEDEFASSVDLSKIPLPTFPILIPTAAATTINFVGIVVTGGMVTIRLTTGNLNFNNIDLPLQGTLLMSGVELSQIVILGVVSGKPYVEVFGSGS